MSKGLNLHKRVTAHDVWGGGHCLFPKDVTIGHGAVIGAGSFITHDVPPYAIVAGSGGGTNSHGIIRGYRFQDEVISDLLELSWWDYDLPKMVSLGIKVPTTDIKDFISFMKNEERDHLIPLYSTWYAYLAPELSIFLGALIRLGNIGHSWKSDSMDYGT